MRSYLGHNAGNDYRGRDVVPGIYGIFCSLQRNSFRAADGCGISDAPERAGTDDNQLGSTIHRRTTPYSGKPQFTYLVQLAVLSARMCLYCDLPAAGCAGWWPTER